MRDGKPFDDTIVSHYVYRITSSPTSTELLYNRPDRRQNILADVTANPETDETQVILREEWATRSIENDPYMRFPRTAGGSSGRSSRNGWSNLYLYEPEPPAHHAADQRYDVRGRQRHQDRRSRGLMFYSARDRENHMKVQLHRVGFDGKGDMRRKVRAFHHVIAGCLRAPRQPAPRRSGDRRRGACASFPRRRVFRGRYQTHDTPPATRLVDAAPAAGGRARPSDLTKFDGLG